MEKVTLGVIGAMQVEIETLREKLTEKQEKTVSGIRFVSGMLHGKRVVTAVCGIGKVFAALCAQTMILEYHPGAIVNTGVAGTLTKRLSLGDVAVSASVVQHDMDTTALGDPAGLVSGLNVVYMAADERLVRLAKHCIEGQGEKCVTGVIASGDVFVHLPEQKKRIVNLFDAVACEMEGAAVGHVCFVNKTPFVVIRAISDSADGNASMDYGTFLARAARASAAVTEDMIAQYEA